MKNSSALESSGQVPLTHTNLFFQNFKSVTSKQITANTHLADSIY